MSRLLGTGIAVCLLAVGWAAPAAAATGSTWQVLTTVNQQADQTTNSEFLGVSMGSPADGWAVGIFDDKNANAVQFMRVVGGGALGGLFRFRLGRGA